MKTLIEICIGALVFISIDRFCKLVSSSIVDNSLDDHSLKKNTLKIELLTLALTAFIAIHFI